MTVLPSQLHHRITLQRATPSADAVGAPTSTLSTLGTVWARMRPQGGGETDEAGQVLGRERAEWVVRSCAVTRGVRVADLFVHEGVVWNIRSAMPFEVEGRRNWIRFLAETEAAQS